MKKLLFVFLSLSILNINNKAMSQDHSFIIVKRSTLSKDLDSNVENGTITLDEAKGIKTKVESSNKKFYLKKVGGALVGAFGTYLVTRTLLWQFMKPRHPIWQQGGNPNSLSMSKLRDIGSLRNNPDMEIFDELGAFGIGIKGHLKQISDDANRLSLFHIFTLFAAPVGSFLGWKYIFSSNKEYIQLDPTESGDSRTVTIISV